MLARKRPDGKVEAPAPGLTRTTEDESMPAGIELASSNPHPTDLPFTVAEALEVDWDPVSKDDGAAILNRDIWNDSYKALQFAVVVQTKSKAELIKLIEDLEATMPGSLDRLIDQLAATRDCHEGAVEFLDTARLRLRVVRRVRFGWDMADILAGRVSPAEARP